jgi:hypothetical protein
MLPNAMTSSLSFNTLWFSSNGNWVSQTIFNIQSIKTSAQLALVSINICVFSLLEIYKGKALSRECVHKCFGSQNKTTYFTTSFKLVWSISDYLTLVSWLDKQFVD